MQEPQAPPPAPSRRWTDLIWRGGPRPGAAIAVAILVAFGIWLGVRGGSNSPTTTTTTTAFQGARAVTTAQLAAIAATSTVPIYWAGPKPGYTYEYRKTPSGRIFVRYLPTGVPAGVQVPYLTVATFPITNAYARISKLARSKKSVRVPVPGNPTALAFYAPKGPQWVFMIFPGVNAEVEVFDPTSGVPQQIVASGQVTPV